MVNLTACSPPPTKKNTSRAKSENMPSVAELLANKAKVDEEFRELLEEVQQKEAEEQK